MTKIDIISGFLGAGKTTFISQLIKAALHKEKVVLIENEFGEIGIDGGFLQDSGIEIREMNQGCICCSLVGDFETSLSEVITKYAPDRIIIEPSGVGKLSDIIGAVKKVSANLEVELNAAVTIVDAKKAKMYARNFGEFFENQIQYAGNVVLSRTDIATEQKVEEAVGIVRGINKDCKIITTPIAELDGDTLLDIISQPDNLEEEMMKEVMERLEEHEHHHHHDDDDEEHEHHHHHHHDGGECDDEECECHHHHDDDDEEHEHHHHHHHDGEECDDEECECHHHEGEHHDGEVHVHNHHHHHHDGEHDADEIFTSWGLETPAKYTREKVEEILHKMSETGEFGQVIRCKGMLPQEGSEKWIHFDMVPEQVDIREGSASYTGKVVVIGADLKEDLIKAAFVG
ncbi:CobW family GTP-binding protein [[Clostridium] aminophilum]|uniref:CobW family GTP-binding protein n=1 Tax=[Clostridium] aminophilum TaxID=1526 RepID=UPI003F98D55A